MEEWIHQFFKDLPEYLSRYEKLKSRQAEALRKKLYAERWFLARIGETCTKIYLKILIQIETEEKPRYYRVRIDLVSRLCQGVCSTHNVRAIDSGNILEKMLWMTELIAASSQVMGGFSSIGSSISSLGKEEVRAICAFERLAKKANLASIFEEEGA